MSDHLLPPGDYPFLDRRLPLRELAMTEAPRELEDLFRRTAVDNGLTLIRDRPVELTCVSENFPEATFLVWWPSGDERLHMLVPLAEVRGRA